MPSMEGIRPNGVPNYQINLYADPIYYMAFKTTHNKYESLPQFMKSPQLIFSHKNR